jgi:hypothetical protein
MGNHHKRIADRAETVQVQVEVFDLNAKHLWAACPGGCTFQYRTDRTPSLTFGFLGGSGSKLYRSYGYVFGGDISMYTIRMGGSKCDVNEEINTANPRDYNSLTSNNLGYVNCVLGGDIEAGRVQMLYQVNDPLLGYGQAVYNRRLMQVAPDGSIYHFTQFPHISGLSFSRSGLIGGQELVVSGTGFSWTTGSNVVTVAGAPCLVISSSNTEIRCRLGSVVTSTPPQAVGVSYPAGAGLLHRVYLGKIQYDIAEITNMVPATSQVNTWGLQGFLDNTQDYYTQDNMGFFVPPVTANYSFYTRADDFVSVWLSRDSSPANATQIAVTPSYTDQWWSYASQISKPVFLQAGVPYWIRVRHGKEALIMSRMAQSLVMCCFRCSGRLWG